MHGNLFESTRYSRFSTGSRRKLVSHSQLVQGFQKTNQLDRHSGCINAVSWNESGTKLVTGSDDRNVVIWGGSPLRHLFTMPTGHRNNVFSVTFLPNSDDAQLITSAADGCVHLSNVDSGHREVLYDCGLIGYCFKHCMDPLNPSETGLVTLSHGSVIRFDIRQKRALEVICVRDDRNLRHSSVGRFFSALPSATALAFNPIDPYMLALGTTTRGVLLYDTRKLGESSESGGSCAMSKIFPEFPPSHTHRYAESEAVSGVAWDRRNGLIVNYCRERLIEINIGLVECNQGLIRPKVHTSPPHSGRDCVIPRSWVGRDNHQTFLKEVGLMGEDRFVVSGGDCGSLFVWDRFGGAEPILRKPADRFVLNCVCPHPELPILATAGIANVADIWEPTGTPTNRFQPAETHGSVDSSDESSEEGTSSSSDGTVDMDSSRLTD